MVGRKSLQTAGVGQAENHGVSLYSEQEKKRFCLVKAQLSKIQDPCSIQLHMSVHTSSINGR